MILYLYIAKIGFEIEITFRPIASMWTTLKYTHHLIFSCPFSFTPPIHFIQCPIIYCGRWCHTLFYRINPFTLYCFIQLELSICTIQVTQLMQNMYAPLTHMSIVNFAGLIVVIHWWELYGEGWINLPMCQCWKHKRMGWDWYFPNCRDIFAVALRPLLKISA